MSESILLSILAIIVLLVLSAFFSGSETSLTAASRARMHNLEQQGEWRAQLVNELLTARERLIGAILLGNNLVNILASALATSVLIRLFGDTGVVYATVMMTALVLIFAEVMPKTYAIHNADRMALTVAPIMRIVIKVLWPITHAVQLIVGTTLRLFRIRLGGQEEIGQMEEELRGAIDLHATASGDEGQERNMLRSILDLADVEVGEIMIHRRNMVTIDADQPSERIVEQVLDSPYTRIPLYRGSVDNIIGVLHAKALLRAVNAARANPAELDVTSIAAPPWFIPDTTDLLSQLEAFRSRREHFAIVVDEYGEVLGIVTLEDILEEIVGEISDEHDVSVEGVQQLKDGALVIEGSVTLRDLNRQFDWRLPDEEASTIAGLVLHEARRIPEVGQTFVFHGYQFEILGRQRNRITSIKVTPPDSEEAA